MTKLNIESIVIVSKNKEIINALSLKNKNEKYILYSKIDNSDIISDIFIKMEFTENFNIIPKKKFTELNFDIILNQNKYILYMNKKPVYYLKDNKNIILNNEIFKLILIDGKLYKKEDIQINESIERSVVANPPLEESTTANPPLEESATANPPLEESVNPPLEESANPHVEILVNKDTSELNVDSTTDLHVDAKNNIAPAITDKQIDISENKLINQQVTLKDIPLYVSKDNNLFLSVNKYDHKSNDKIEETKIITSVIDENVKENSIDSKINDIVTDIKTFKINNNIQPINIVTNEKIKYITDNIREEKIDLNNKRNELETDVFNLENILSDFNKLFSLIDNNPIERKKNVVEEVKKNVEVEVKKNVEAEVKKKLQTEVKKNVEAEVKKNIEEVKTIYITYINYQFTNYRLNTIKFKNNVDLNYSNLFTSKIYNIVNQSNIAFELEKENFSYLFIFFGQKYLINKINNTIILTNLFNRSSQIIKNKDNLKIGNYDYILYNDCTLIFPVLNKKIFDNSYGTSYNLYIPKN